MNKKLQKQIKAYAGIAGALLVTDKTSGQVVHVDVNPDTLVNADPVNSGYHHFLLDFNNDAVSDFHFRVKYSSSSYGRFAVVDPLDSIQIKNRLYTFYPNGALPYPAKLNPGELIDANGSWINDSFQCMIGSWHTSNPQPGHLNYSGSCGVWVPGTDKCFGFRTVQNSNYYYGWLRLHFLTRSSFLLKEYAYQSQPNVPILACDTTNLATGISQNNIQLNFSQQNNSIYISTIQNLNQPSISVYDLLGKEILQQPFEGKKTTITINKKGIYFVEVKSEKGIFRKKIFIH